MDPSVNQAGSDQNMEQTAAAHRCVRLEIPSEHAYVRIARLVASGVGAAVGFDIDEIDDLRIAVDELCALAIDASGSAPLSLTFVPSPDAVEVRGEVATTWDDGEVPVTEQRVLSAQILRVVTDEQAVLVSGGQLSFRLVKRRHGPA